MTIKGKFKELLKNRKKIVKGGEGLSPVYDENGVILPKYEGLGPKYFKDLKMKVMPKEKLKEEIKKKKDKQPWIKNIRHLA